MNINPLQVAITFIAALAATLVGVLFFFDPVTEGDATFVAVHPAFGVIVYVGLSVAIFIWSTVQTQSPFKGAVVVAAPQIILIIDLTLRGDRGVVTASAGTALLVFTWLIVAYTYSRLEKRTSPSDT